MPVSLTLFIGLHAVSVIVTVAFLLSYIHLRTLRTQFFRQLVSTGGHHVWEFRILVSLYVGFTLLIVAVSAYMYFLLFQP